MSQDFDLSRLRKHVERRNALEGEGRSKVGQVAGKGRWIGRDVKQRSGRIAPEDFTDISPQTGCGRIDNHSGSLWIGLPELFSQMKHNIARNVSLPLGRTRLGGGDGMDVPIKADNPR